MPDRLLIFYRYKKGGLFVNWNPRNGRKMGSAVLAGALLLFGLASCKPTEDVVSAASTVSASPSSQAAGTIPASIQQSFPNGLTIDAAVTVPDGWDLQAVATQQMNPVVFDSDKVAGQLLAGKDIANHQTLTPGPTRGGNETPQDIYTTADDTHLNLDPALGSVRLTTPQAEAISYAYFPEETSEYYNRDAYTAESLPFMAPEDAHAQVCAQLVEMGLPDLSDGPYEVVALDHETLQQQEQDPKQIDIKPETAPEKKGTWTQDDDCYVFTLHPALAGEPADTQVDLSLVARPTVTVYYGPAGFLSIEGGFYEPAGEPAAQAVVPVEQAVQTFTDFYSTKKYASEEAAEHVTDIALVYYFHSAGDLTDTCEIWPVWNFRVETGLESTPQFVMVDAVTGLLVDTRVS